MRATVLSEQREAIGEVIFSYSPSDRAAQAVSMEVVPFDQVKYVKEDIEEPPPTMEELMQHQKSDKR